MGGWKTWAAAIGMWLTGLGLLISGYVNSDAARITEGITTILAGLALVGIGHKLEK